MRTILMFAVFGILLLHPAVSSADANAECQSECINEKATRDSNCPQSEDDPVERAQCLRDSQDEYKDCVNNCPPPEPIDAPAQN